MTRRKFIKGFVKTGLIYIPSRCAAAAMPLERMLPWFTAGVPKGGGGGGSGFPTGSLVDWKFNNDLTDSSGNAHDASVLAGSISYGNDESSLSLHAAVFNGSTHVGLSDATVAEFGATAFSVSCVFNATSISGNPVLISKGQFNIAGYYLQIFSTGQLKMLFNQSGAQQATQTAVGAIATAIWYRVVFTWDGVSGHKGKLYVNGTDVTDPSSQILTPPDLDGTAALISGDYSGGSAALTGSIAEDGVWARELTPTEVAGYTVSQ